MNLNKEKKILKNKEEIKILKEYIKKIELDNIFLFEQNNKLKNIMKQNNIYLSDIGMVNSLEIHKNNCLKNKLSKSKIIPLLQLKKEIKKIQNKEIMEVISHNRSSQSIYNYLF